MSLQFSAITSSLQTSAVSSGSSTQIVASPTSTFTAESPITASAQPPSTPTAIAETPASSTNTGSPAFTIIAAFWVALDSPDLNPQVLSTPKFDGRAMGFTIHDNTDFQAGASYGNPAVQDFPIRQANDVFSCMSQCTQYNLGMPHENDAFASCSGVVFFSDMACWLKTGVNESSVPHANNQAMAAILHLLE